jgi:O-antigen/teichoic acid export membrane protein
VENVTVEALTRSSAYAALSSIWHIGSRIFLTPLILAKIGLEGYGIWALLFSVAGPINTVGASFGLAYAKFTAEYEGRRDYTGLNQLLGSAILLIGGFALVAMTVVWLARAPILGVLGVPEATRGDAGQALMLVGVTIVLQLSVGCVTQVAAGFQRTDLRYKAIILSSVIYFTGAIVLLQRGWGLVGLGVSYLAGEAVGIGFCWLACRQLCPPLRLSPLRATREGMRRVLSLGGRFQLLFFLTQTSSVGFNMLVSALLGPASLGTYNLALQLIRLGETGASAVLAPMMPAFASLYYRGKRQRADVLYLHGSRLLFAVTLVSLGFLTVFADEVLIAWTNQEHPLAAWTLRVTAVSFLVKQLTGMGTQSLRGQGRLGLEYRLNLVTLAVLWGTVVPAYALLGYQGMVLSAALGLVLGALWFLRQFHREEGVPFGAFLREVVLRPLLVLSPVIAGLAVLDRAMDTVLTLERSRWAVLGELALWGASFGVTAALLTWFLILSRSERESVLGRARTLTLSVIKVSK